LAFPDFEQRQVPWTDRRKAARLVYNSVLQPISTIIPSTGSIYDLRVEANDINSATIRWSYNGTNDVKIYRSLDNISYTLDTTVTSTFPTTAYEYTDDGTLAERILYYYKLTDNNGFTYSDIVHVVSYLIAMPSGNATNRTVSVPQAVDQVTPQDFNALIDKINLDNQASFNQSSAPCDVCSQNNALVIDCSSGCTWFRTILNPDTYINSISLIGCDGCPPIDFVLPPNQNRSICGWPVGCNFEKDECFHAPIPGGPNGRVAKTTGQTYGGYWNAAAPETRTESCPCPQSQRSLAITCCADCTLSCA